MNFLYLIAPLAILFAPLPVQAALDPDCEAVIKVNEVSANAPTWEKIVAGPNNFKIETRKINNQYYSRINGGNWLKQNAGFDAAVKNFAKETRTGKIKVTRCQNEGSETLNGVETSIISFHVEMAGAPPSKGKVYIGKADGLPYAESSDKMQTEYHYQNIVAPIP